MLCREIRKVALSIPYLLFVAVILLAYFTQAAFPKRAAPPVPGAAGYSRYGTAQTGDIGQIMQKSLDDLYYEFTGNQYVTYPLGFYKAVRLNETKREGVANLLSQMLRDTSPQQLLTAAQPTYRAGEMAPRAGPDGTFTLVPAEAMAAPGKIVSLHPADIPFETFAAHMAAIDALLGGGSNYSRENLMDYGTRPYTYPEAQGAYRQFETRDKISGAYARLFCDYLCIFATLAAVFVTVGEGLRDRRAQMEPLVWTRPVSSARLAFTRYTAAVLLCLLPIVLAAAADLLFVVALYPGQPIDPLVHFAYVLGWILPGVMLSAAVGQLLTEITDTPVAILAMGLWWMFSLNSAPTLIGNYIPQPFTLMPRHNSLFYRQAFDEGYANLVINRAFYTGLALALVALAAGVLALKRKGRWFGLDALKTLAVHCKSKPSV